MLLFKTLRFGDWLIRKRLSLLLAPVSWIWGLVSTGRNWLYDRRWLPIHRVGIPVVSVGNLSVGGTGKTPLVIFLAKQFPKRKVAILARGYGSRNGELNDEMRVIRRHAPLARLYQGPDRVALAKQAEAEGADWILLDDGFQHRRLHRDLDLVIARPEDAADHFLPRGYLRDSQKRLKQATAVTLRARPTRIVDRFGQEISSIRGEKVALFCAIARPERFKKTVQDLGAIVIAEKIFGDHEPFSLHNVLGAKYLVCTEKDFVKLARTDLPVIWIEIEAEVLEREKLVAKIAHTLNN